MVGLGRILKGILVLWCGVSIGMAGCLSEASAKVRWLETTYDFGLFKEAGGPRTGHASMINEGPDTISIFSVRPSCGCTSAEFSDLPMAPGDTSTISFTYDPAMRPGKFDKSVRVRLSDGSGQTIRIRGNVLGTPESLSMLYPAEAGAVRLNTSIVDAGRIGKLRTVTSFLNAYLLGPDSLSPILQSPSKALRISPSVSKAGPGDIITYSFTFDANLFGEVGPVDMPLTLRSAPDAEPTVVTYKAWIVPDTMRLLAAQKGNNPIMRLPSQPISFTKDKKGRWKAKVEISNAGNGPLQILRVITDDRARGGAAEIPSVSVNRLPKPIAPGKSASLEVEVNERAIGEKPYRMTLSLISTDPAHPVQDVTIVVPSGADITGH